MWIKLWRTFKQLGYKTVILQIKTLKNAENVPRYGCSPVRAGEAGTSHCQEVHKSATGATEIYSSGGMTITPQMECQIKSNSYIEILKKSLAQDKENIWKKVLCRKGPNVKTMYSSTDLAFNFIQLLFSRDTEAGQIRYEDEWNYIQDQSWNKTLWRLQKSWKEPEKKWDHFVQCILFCENGRVKIQR